MEGVRFFCLVTICSFISLGAPTPDSARVQQETVRSTAFLEIHNAMLKAQEVRIIEAAFILRSQGIDSILQTESVSPLAAVKRKLLGRQSLTCDPGYALCPSESRMIMQPSYYSQVKEMLSCCCCCCFDRDYFSQ